MSLLLRQKYSILSSFTGNRSLLLLLPSVLKNDCLQAKVKYSTKSNVQDYEAKWTMFFKDSAFDQFELQRGLNHCFNHDLVPTIPVLESALRASRRLNDLSGAIRIFGALREKCATDQQYREYVKHLEPIKQELGISAPEDFGRL